MRYTMVDADGQEYGPADIETLKQWVRQGRVRPETKLIHVESGQRFIAGSVAALGYLFAARPTAPPVAQQPVSPWPPHQSAGNNDGADPGNAAQRCITVMRARCRLRGKGMDAQTVRGVRDLVLGALFILAGIVKALPGDPAGDTYKLLSPLVVHVRDMIFQVSLFSCGIGFLLRPGLLRLSHVFVGLGVAGLIIGLALWADMTF